MPSIETSATIMYAIGMDAQNRELMKEMLTESQLYEQVNEVVLFEAYLHYMNELLEDIGIMEMN